MRSALLSGFFQPVNVARATRANLDIKKRLETNQAFYTHLSIASRQTSAKQKGAANIIKKRTNKRQ